MKGSIRIVAEARDGSHSVLLEEDNYVLVKSRAYLLNHLYSGNAPIDPIVGFRIGSGAAQEASPFDISQSYRVDDFDGMFAPLECEDEISTKNNLYDQTAITHSNESTPTALGSIHY